MKRFGCGKVHKGSTLIEMLVCFALLGIFMTASAVVIANVTNIYFDVKGQTQGRRVAGILLERISGEIEGAKVDAANPFTRPVIFQDPEDALAGNRSGYKIDLYDRTDTHLQMYAEDGELKIRYFEINPEKEDASAEYNAGHMDETIWTFDDDVYQGYLVKSLRFVPANQGIPAGVEANTMLDDAAYGKDSETDYPGNVVGVYLTLESPQYGEFFAYKYIKMYNLTDKEASGYTIPLLSSKDCSK